MMKLILDFILVLKTKMSFKALYCEQLLLRNPFFLLDHNSVLNTLKYGMTSQNNVAWSEQFTTVNPIQRNME